jgi:hypothetical protein
MKFKKYFTLSEANRMLPLIRSIVQDILLVASQMKQLIIDNPDHYSEINEFNHLKIELNKYLNELEELGCFYKDWNFTVGLVDFPAIIDGNEVFLCWRADEEQIQYYHLIDESYSSRKSLFC